MKRLQVYFPLMIFLMVMSGGIGCKKVQDDFARKFIVNAMTDGRWLVAVFEDNNEDITESFSDYEFQFEKNGKVQAIKKSTQGVVMGDWEGNASDLTIYSDFSGVGEPLINLNDTWKIINNTMKLVEAKPFNSGRKAYLKLIKKE